MALPKINSVGGERLRGDAVVVIQSAAESTATMNSSCGWRIAETTVIQELQRF
jgi:hypothetical protein